MRFLIQMTFPIKTQHFNYQIPISLTTEYEMNNNWINLDSDYFSRKCSVRRKEETRNKSEGESRRVKLT